MADITNWYEYMSRASDILINDPGTATPLPISKCGIVNLTIAAGVAETNTLADPIRAGLALAITARNVGASGTHAVTFASANDPTGNTVYTFRAAGDTLFLVSIPVAAGFKWRLVNATAGLGSGTVSTTQIQMTAFRKIADITANPASAAAGSDLGLIDGTIGTASPVLSSGDLKNTTTTRSVRFQTTVPSNYIAGSPATMVVTAGMTGGFLASVTASLPISIFRQAAPTVNISNGSNASMNGLTQIPRPTTNIVVTNLVPGDILDVSLGITINDGQAINAIIGAISFVQLTYTVK